MRGEEKRVGDSGRRHHLAGHLDWFGVGTELDNNKMSEGERQLSPLQHRTRKRGANETDPSKLASTTTPASSILRLGLGTAIPVGSRGSSRVES